MSDLEKENFLNALRSFADTLTQLVSTNGGSWSIKGFVDVNKSVYTISSDTKLISKILEIQLFPEFSKFAEAMGYEIILAEKQNWYPDLSFVKKNDNSVKFAVDIKTTYRLPEYQDFCNGFTLGSHGEYFRNRTSQKNVQFPYGAYCAHITLGVIYTRALVSDIDESQVKGIDDLASITSVINNFLFFAEEKWKIASDRSGSGNTANIGSIDYIPDILSGNGIFANLGEDVFDAYWINKGRLKVPNMNTKGAYKTLTKIEEFVEFKGIDVSMVNKRKRKVKS